MTKGHWDWKKPESHHPQRAEPKMVAVISQPRKIQFLGSAFPTGYLAGLHVALALEDGSFLDDQFSGSDVANKNSL